MCPTGSISVTQTRKGSDLHSAFDLLDVDRDGKISPEDLRAFHGSFSCDGMLFDKDIIRFMIMVADSNEDGCVEYDEFEKVLQLGNFSEVKNGRWSLLEDVFRVMDKDGDGKVGHQDLKSYLRWAGFEADDDDVKTMIKLGGGQENGGVTFEGLLKILAV